MSNLKDSCSEISENVCNNRRDFLVKASVTAGSLLLSLSVLQLDHEEIARAKGDPPLHEQCLHTFGITYDEADDRDIHRVVDAEGQDMNAGVFQQLHHAQQCPGTIDQKD